MNMGLKVGWEQDSSSTLHHLLMMATTGKASDIVGNAGEGGGLETACPGVCSASEIERSWSGAECANVRVHQRHRVFRAV